MDEWTERDRTDVSGFVSKEGEKKREVSIAASLLVLL